MENRQLFGIIGSLTLFLGVFAPIVSVPVIGNINYFQNGKGDGSIILLLAIISFVLTLTRRYRGLWFTSGATLLVMLITFIGFHSKMNELKAQLGAGHSNNLFQGLADVAVQSIQMQWGWALLLAGIALLIAAAAMSDGLTASTRSLTQPQSRPLNIPNINWMPVLVGLGVLIILFLIGIIWNMGNTPPPVSKPQNNMAAQTDQTIQQLQNQNVLSNVPQDSGTNKQLPELETQQPGPSADPATLNIQPNQNNNQRPISEDTAREELVTFFQEYYTALENNDVSTLEHLWDMNVPQATKSINIVKKRIREGIRGHGCNINTAKMLSFTQSPIQATIYIDATCDVDGLKTDRFHSRFELEKTFMGEWKLLKQTSER